MDELFTVHSDIAHALYVSQLIDEGTLLAWAVALASSVARLLSELFLRAVRIGLSNGVIMEPPLSQLVLADVLGMTSVHINRMLQDLWCTGAVELRRGVLRIQDAAC